MNTKLADKSRSFLQTEPIHEQWESDYLNPDMDHFYNLAFADILKRTKVSPESTILDAGCGYCYHTKRLARSGAKISAVDFSETALVKARKTINEAGIGNQISLQHADLTALPFSDGSFDLVVSWGVLMHIPEMESALGELARVLKPRGMLVLCENNMRSPDVVIRERSIYLLKKALGRGNAQMNFTPRGVEVWNKTESGGLMVRKTNMVFLENLMKSLGLLQIARTAGQFTEAYTNVPARILKRLLYAFNAFYFKRGLSPDYAVGNIIYFQKT